MMEVWGIIGRALLDRAFHEQLFEASGQGHRFEELTMLRDLLRRELRLNMSRWEIMVTHRILTERHLNVVLPAQPINSAGDDQEIIPIRQGWPGPAPAFFEDFDLCAAVGLASMDMAFRQRLFDASDPNPAIGIPRLETLLTNPPGESPIFNRLSEQNLGNLNSFIRGNGVLGLLEDFHITRWVQPDTYPCNGGYTDTQDTTFKFFSQPDLIKLVETDPEMRQRLRGARALQY